MDKVKSMGISDNTQRSTRAGRALELSDSTQSGAI